MWVVSFPPPPGRFQQRGAFGSPGGWHGVAHSLAGVEPFAGAPSGAPTTKKETINVPNLVNLPRFRPRQKTTRAWDDALHERDGEWGHRFKNGAQCGNLPRSRSLVG